MPEAGSQWHTFVITAKGNRMIVEINSVQAADVEDSKFASGPFAL